eukprot:CAMPEP_0172838590 /NCGR_PEP_ID=MMETSP1075-20121228/27979_1 /TAXON_ID=2916 /ORGANISM="Ceratium fusus, Strain PA161109" /LENGTH=91 /DNA_ID=CAMNT_0013682117 /DNA_START=87 /DNA_END=359 /DNA_ORIENTATION=-
MKMTRHMRNAQRFASGEQQFMPEERCKSAWAADVARDLDAHASASEAEETPASVQVPQTAYTDTQNVNPHATGGYGHLPHPKAFHNKTLED